MYRPDQSEEVLVPISAPRRRYLHVAEQLLEAITNGSYPPGSRIPSDREIAAFTHVSRPTVREALLALEIVGVVEVQPGAGVFVGTGAGVRRLVESLALDAPPELMEARAEIEPVLAGMCAVNLDGSGLAELRGLVAECARATAESKPLSRLNELGLAFHRRLALACGNRILGEMVCGLVDVERHPLWVLVNELALRHPSAQDLQVREHAAILDAIESGDPALAREAMARHLDAARVALFEEPG